MVRHLPAKCGGGEKGNVRSNYSSTSASVSYLHAWKHKAVISGPAVGC